MMAISPTWYGLMYVLSFGLAWLLLPKLQKYRGLSLSRDDWLYILALGITGVVLGGRIGYVLFYEPAYFINNPAEILAVWQGGMSYHGGLIGVGVAIFWAARHLKINIWALADVIVVPAALGLALGRFGNYINQELFIGVGAWYAIAKNIFIAGVCYWVLVNKKQSGFALAVFLILYAKLRFLVEFARLPEWQVVGFLTYGQLLTVPLLLWGMWLWKARLQR